MEPGKSRLTARRPPRRWTLLLEAAGLAALLSVGFASILIDARVGFPAVLALIAGRLW